MISEMITEEMVRYIWEHRHTMINIEHHLCGEEEVMYIMDVLHYLHIPWGDCYLSDELVIKRVLQAKDKGTNPRECAEQLMEANKRIGEYA